MILSGLALTLSLNLSLQDEDRPAKRTRKGRKTKAEPETEAPAIGDESQTPSTPVAETKPSEPAEVVSRRKAGGSGNWSDDDKGKSHPYRPPHIPISDTGAPDSSFPEAARPAW